MKQRRPASKTLKWIGLTLAAFAVLYALWFISFLVGFMYASSKYQKIDIGEPRALVESKTGLLLRREISASELGGYQAVIGENADNPKNTIISYGIFGAGFVVIYDQYGTSVNKVDIWLDG